MAAFTTPLQLYNISVKLHDLLSVSCAYHPLKKLMKFFSDETDWLITDSEVSIIDTSTLERSEALNSMISLPTKESNTLIARYRDYLQEHVKGN